MIVCAAIVGQQNNPLYLRTFPTLEGEALLRFHYIVHCSLDAIEEKVLLKRSPGEAADCYLGLLYPTEEFKVYGYISNTSIKLVLVVDDAIVKDDAVSRVLKRLHALYVEVACNPFHVFGLPIKSAKFDMHVEAIVASYTSKPQSSVLAM